MWQLLATGLLAIMLLPLAASKKLRSARILPNAARTKSRVFCWHDWRGQGIGTLLLRDALERAVSASETLGVAALLIHCRDEEAKKFYEYHADVLESPLDPLQLILPMKSIRKLLG